MRCLSWQEYELELENNLTTLVEKLKRKASKPLPTKRVYIPKGNGEKRPLGISTIENKIVESGITRILQSIYEADCYEFSYGFRPKKNAHQALKVVGDRINFKVGRKTSYKKFRAKVKVLNLWLKKIRNQILTKDWWKILALKLQGHYEYYGVSENYLSIYKFYKLAIKLAKKWMNRRSQKKKMSWSRMTSYLLLYPLPKPSIRHNFYTSSHKV